MEREVHLVSCRTKSQKVNIHAYEGYEVIQPQTGDANSNIISWGIPELVDACNLKLEYAILAFDPETNRKHSHLVHEDLGLEVENRPRSILDPRLAGQECEPRDRLLPPRG